MESTLSQKFIKSIQWNAIEAIPYQIILSLHNAALFKVLGPTVYGLIGTLFSAVFFLVGITNLGFDAALPTFFLDAQENKSSFRKIIGAHVLPTWISWCLAIPLLFYILQLEIMTPLLLFLIALLIFVEGLKKIIRALLHGAFYNKQTAIIELFQIVMYVIYIWASYALCLKPDTTYMCIGLICISTMCTVMLGYYLYIFYLTLPDSYTVRENELTLSRIIRQRIYTAVICINRQVFSGNALILLFACTFGLTFAGTLKVISSIIYSVTLCIQKIFGSTTDALFAHVKYGKLQDKQQVFFLVTKHIHEALYTILLFGVFTSFLFYASGSSLTDRTMSISVLIFFIIHISEQFFNSYEHFFISENRACEFMLFNGITIGCLYGSIYLNIIQTPIAFLQAIACIRMISFFVLRKITFLWWNIRPVIHINPLYLICSLSISLLCFLLIR